MEEDTLRVEASRTINTYVKMRDAARAALKFANEHDEASYYNRMTAIIYSAFAMEAYLNHLGLERMKCWEDLERKLSPEAKLRLLAETMEYDIDFGSRPFQASCQIFKFRSALAHGKTETIEYEYSAENEEVTDRSRSPLAWWEAFCTHENAERSIEDVEQMITILHMKANLGDNPFWTTESSVHRDPDFIDRLRRKGEF